MNKIAFLLTLFLAGYCNNLFAQSDSDGTALRPSAPYLEELPDQAAWTLTFTPKPSPVTAQMRRTAPAGPIGTKVLSVSQLPTLPDMEDQMATMKITKAGSLMRKSITWLNGQQSEDWMAGNVFFHQDPISKRYGFRKASADPYGEGGRDFPDLNWIKSSRFLKIEQKGGESCFLYRCTETRTRYSTGQVEIALPFRPTFVWVSIHTKLPVVLEDDVKSITYQFFPSTETSLTLPDECHKFLDLIANYEVSLQAQKMVAPH